MLFFAHIPKCGGSTIKKLFYSALGKKHCVKIWDPKFGADFSVRDFPILEPGVFSNKKAIVGHLRFSQLLKNTHMRERFENDELRIVTVTRDPIDRIISLYNYINSFKKHPSHIEVKHSDPVDFLFNQPDNQQNRFLQYHANEPINSIVDRVACFSIDNSESNVRRWLESETQQKIAPVKKVNVTRKRFPWADTFHRSDLTSKQIQYLELRHSKDLKLHEVSKHKRMLQAG